MPRTDRPIKSSNLEASTITKARNKENVVSSVETNTEPWQPSCQTCRQRQNSPFILTNNTIDMNEYVKAINYINSIHSLINETLLSKPEQGLRRNSNLNMTANISMPDLPNFLTLLSGVTNFNNYANTNSSQMISRTTSTSTLTNTATIVNKLVKQTEEGEDCSSKCNEYTKEEDSEDPNTKQDLLDSNFDEMNGYGDQRSHSADEEVSDTELYQEADSANFAEQSKTDAYYVVQEQECNCRHCSHSNLKRSFEKNNTANTEEEMSSHGQHSHQHSKQAIQSKPHEHQNIDLQRKKATPEIPKSYQVATKSKDNCNGDRKKSSNENRGGFEPGLSDAELDRYASELLIGVDWESCDRSTKSDTNQSDQLSIVNHDCLPPTSPQNTRPLPGETAFTFKVPLVKHVVPAEKVKTTSRLPPTSPEGGRRKSVQKPKEAPPPAKQKTYTHIPVKQTFRTNTPITKRCSSRSCSPVKNRTSTSSMRSGSPYGPHRRQSTPHNSEECTATHNEKQESVKTFTPSSNVKLQTLNFQLPSLTTLEKSKLSPKHHTHTNSRSNTSSTHHNHVAFHSQKKLHEGHMKKGAVMYKVQQKEDDDFICPRKAFRTHLMRKSSESVILSDKEEQGITIAYANSDTRADVCEVSSKETKAFTFQSKGSHGNLQISPRIPSRNDLDNALQEVQRSNERFVVSIPARRRKDVRNKPFRQARRQSGDSEEIVHLRNYITPCKQLNDSDSNSNDSGSSDIKSDKEVPPSSEVFKIQQNVPVNYISQSREHIQHKM